MTTVPLQTPVDEKEAQSVPNIEYLLPNIGRTAAPGDAAGEEQHPWHRSPRSWHWNTPRPLSTAETPMLTPPRAASLSHHGHGKPGCAGAGHPSAFPTGKWGHPPSASRATSLSFPITLLPGGCSSSLSKPAAHGTPALVHAANPEPGRL